MFNTATFIHHPSSQAILLFSINQEWMGRELAWSARRPEFGELGSQSCCSHLAPAGLEAKLCHRSLLKNRGSRLPSVMIIEAFWAGLVQGGYKTQPEFQVFCVLSWWPWFSLTCTCCCHIRRGCMSKEKYILPFLYTGKKGWHKLQVVKSEVHWF